MRRTLRTYRFNLSPQVTHLVTHYPQAVHLCPQALSMGEGSKSLTKSSPNRRTSLRKVLLGRSSTNKLKSKQEALKAGHLTIERHSATSTPRQKSSSSFRLVIPSGARNLRPARQEIPRSARNDKLAEDFGPAVLGTKKPRFASNSYLN